MTDDVRLMVDRLVPDYPFLLDWHDVQLRSDQMRESDISQTGSRSRRNHFARRSVVIAAVVTLSIIVPLTALAVRFVFNSAPAGHPLMLSSPLEIRLMPDGSAAGGSISLAIAGRQRTVQAALIADFQLTHHPPFSLANVPTPPPGHVAISIRHFAATGEARLWPRVNRLQLPADTGGQKRLTLHVRIVQEAIEVEIRFGSTPTQSMRASANAILAGVIHD